MDSKIEVARLISGFRALMRDEIGRCERAIEEGDMDEVRKEMSRIHDKVARAIYVLNRLR